MYPYDSLVDIEYLVFSSHKTSTQTTVNTLNKNGFYSKHCHYTEKALLNNLSLNDDLFKDFVLKYKEVNNKKLNIISVFREPIERHMSSFFQFYGTRPIRLKEVENEKDTIIYKDSVRSLQKKFINLLKEKSLHGMSESIHDISRALNIKIDDISFDKPLGQGVFENKDIVLHLYSFDCFVRNIESVLSRLLKKNVTIYTYNISKQKWYGDIYSEFKKDIVIPRTIIDEIYAEKRQLIDLICLDGFDGMLKKAYLKYSSNLAQHSF